jgi:hypothetical protein
LLEKIRTGTNILGEITPSYATLNQDVIAQIKNTFPKIKIIFIMRNPVDREWSHAKMKFLKLRGKTAEDYNMDEFTSFLEKKNMKSEYMYTIRNWLNVFPRDQIKFCFYDKLKNEPLAFLNDIADFFEDYTISSFTFKKQNKYRCKT